MTQDTIADVLAEVRDGRMSVYKALAKINAIVAAKTSPSDSKSALGINPCPDCGREMIRLGRDRGGEDFTCAVCALAQHRQSVPADCKETSIEPRGGGAESRQHADAGVESPAHDGPVKAREAGAEPAIPCTNAAQMGEYACLDRFQCWEPCGALGNDDAHVRVAAPDLGAAIDRAMGLKMISIRLPQELIDRYKDEALRTGTPYQRLMREGIAAYAPPARGQET